MCVLLGVAGKGGEDIFGWEAPGRAWTWNWEFSVLNSSGNLPRRLGLPSNEIQIHLIEHGS